MLELVTSRECVEASARVADVAERFRKETTLEAIAVVDKARKTVGLLDRTKVLLKLAHQYGYALYARAAVDRVMDPGALVVRDSDFLEQVLDKVLARPESDIYDAVLVVDDRDELVGTVSVKQLIMHQTTALANATLERQLIDQRAQELTKLNALKSNFIAHVTHELRAPVNAIIGISELLFRSSQDGDVNRMQEMLALLTSSATSLRALITNVLDLSKLEAGRMDVIVETFEATALLREVAGVTRVLVDRKPVTVEVVAHDGQIWLQTDPVKLKQILVNLASNAAKFTDRGSVSLTLRSEADALVFCVEDTGIGMTPQQQASIFEPFVQVGDVHTRRHDGTGLGLTITAKLLELLGGSIELDSTRGRGTRFTVTFSKRIEVPCPSGS
jgi:signal transduction histidine kinase